MRAYSVRFLALCAWLERQLGGTLLFVASMLVCLQIVVRHLGFSISGLYEVAAFCTIWSVFLTAGVGIRRNIHVRVDILMRVVPPRYAYYLELLSLILILAVVCFMCYSGVLLINESYAFGDKTLGTIRIPMWLPQAIMPLGGLLMAAHTLARLLDVLRLGAARFRIEDIEPPALES